MTFFDKSRPSLTKKYIIAIVSLMVLSLCSISASAQEFSLPLPEEDATLPQDSTEWLDAEVLARTPVQVQAELEGDTIKTVLINPNSPYGLDGKKVFNPDPTRAVWLSVLFPGLGQIYNRRYWKLPIIVGGFMALGYGTSWNNGQYQDYSQAYRDLLDNDPSSNSYMNFFPPNTDEGSLDKNWLTNVMKSRKDFYRRNRDLCIICMVGVYLLCVVDAYVDASLAHFDISPDLSMDVAPTIMVQPGNSKPGVGLHWALTF